MTAERVRAAERVCVIGCSGAGKSTLSRALGEILDLPIVHFDQLHWAPGWTERSDAETQARVDQAVGGTRWITDGNYARFSAARFERADLVVWLDYPRRICMRQVLERIWQTHGIVRDDMGEGCPEQLDIAFLRWVWNWHRDERPGTLTTVQELSQPVVWLRHPKQTQRWLASLR